MCVYILVLREIKEILSISKKKRGKNMKIVIDTEKGTDCLAKNLLLSARPHQQNPRRRRLGQKMDGGGLRPRPVRKGHEGDHAAAGR